MLSAVHFEVCMGFEPDAAKAREVADKYEVIFRSIAGVETVLVAGSGIYLGAVNKETADLVRAVIASEIEGVPVTVGSPAKLSTSSDHDQVGLPGIGPGGHAGEPPDGPVLPPKKHKT